MTSYKFEKCYISSIGIESIKIQEDIYEKYKFVVFGCKKLYGKRG